MHNSLSSRAAVVALAFWAVAFLLQGCALHVVSENGDETIVGFPIVVVKRSADAGTAVEQSSVTAVGVVVHKAPTDTAVTVGYANSAISLREGESGSAERTFIAENEIEPTHDEASE